MVSAMNRCDKWDYIGMGLAALLAVMWVAHFVLPAPPPEPPDATATAPQMPFPQPPGNGLPTLPGAGLPGVK
jgi:hypothetical protein